MSPTSSVPDGGIGMWASIVGIGTTVLGIFAGMVGIGKKIEHVEGKIKNHEEALKDIFGIFKDGDGNPRFVTVVVCEKNTAKCSLHYNDKFSHVGERITALVIEISELRKDMKTTQDATLEAILKAIKDK